MLLVKTLQRCCRVAGVLLLQVSLCNCLNHCFGFIYLIKFSCLKSILDLFSSLDLQLFEKCFGFI